MHDADKNVNMGQIYKTLFFLILAFDNICTH